MSEAAVMTPEERSRRNVRLALAHGVVAIGFMLFYVWYRVHTP